MSTALEYADELVKQVGHFVNDLDGALKSINCHHRPREVKRDEEGNITSFSCKNCWMWWGSTRHPDITLDEMRKPGAWFTWWVRDRETFLRRINNETKDAIDKQRFV